MYAILPPGPSPAPRKFSVEAHVLLSIFIFITTQSFMYSSYTRHTQSANVRRLEKVRHMSLRIIASEIIGLVKDVY